MFTHSSSYKGESIQNSGQQENHAVSWLLETNRNVKYESEKTCKGKNK